jgi:beta-lactam-binding protein with PASTA domain
MSSKFFFKSDTLGGVLLNMGLAVVIVLLVVVIFFYVYLPNSTNHGSEITMPDLIGKNIYEADNILEPMGLRYEVGDSSYSAEQPPLTILQQFPKAGHKVKENRKVLVSINRKSTPTLPLPNLFGEGNSGSLVGAEAILRSNELKTGKIIYRHHPSRDLLIEIRMDGKVITPGTRIPKGSVIDLVVGDGGGPKDFRMANMVGLTYKNALLRLGNLSLYLGTVQIPDDVDTTDVATYVLKQLPAAGDSVSVGDPIDLWIGPKGYQLKEEENENDHQP